MRAEYPNQLDYSGVETWNMVAFICGLGCVHVNLQLTIDDARRHGRQLSAAWHRIVCDKMDVDTS